jgi:hypothetical protein
LFIFWEKERDFQRRNCFELRWKKYGRPINGTRCVARNGEKVGRENRLSLEF